MAIILGCFVVEKLVYPYLGRYLDIFGIKWRLSKCIEHLFEISTVTVSKNKCKPEDLHTWQLCHLLSETSLQHGGQ